MSRTLTSVSSTSSLSGLAAQPAGVAAAPIGLKSHNNNSNNRSIYNNLSGGSTFNNGNNNSATSPLPNNSSHNSNPYPLSPTSPTQQPPQPPQPQSHGLKSSSSFSNLRRNTSTSSIMSLAPPTLAFSPSSVPTGASGAAPGAPMGSSGGRNTASKGLSLSNPSSTSAMTSINSHPGVLSPLQPLAKMPDKVLLHQLARNYVVNQQGLVVGISSHLPYSAQAAIVEYIDLFTLNVLAYSNQWYYIIAALSLDYTCVMVNLLACDFFVATEDIGSALQCLKRAKTLIGTDHQPVPVHTVNLRGGNQANNVANGPKTPNSTNGEEDKYDNATPDDLTVSTSSSATKQSTHQNNQAVVASCNTVMTSILHLNPSQPQSPLLPHSITTTPSGLPIGQGKLSVVNIVTTPLGNSVCPEGEVLVSPTTITRREILYFQAYDAWLSGNIQASLGYWLTITSLYPADIFAAKRAQLMSFLSGNQAVNLNVLLIPSSIDHLTTLFSNYWLSMKLLLETFIKNSSLINNQNNNQNNIVTSSSSQSNTLSPSPSDPKPNLWLSSLTHLLQNTSPMALTPNIATPQVTSIGSPEHHFSTNFSQNDHNPSKSVQSASVMSLLASNDLVPKQPSFTQPTSSSITSPTVIQPSIHTYYHSFTRLSYYFGMLSFALEQTGSPLHALHSGYLGTLISLIQQYFYHFYSESIAIANAAPYTTIYTPSHSSGNGEDGLYNEHGNGASNDQNDQNGSQNGSQGGQNNNKPQPRSSLTKHSLPIYNDPWSHHGLFHALFALAEHSLAIPLALSLSPQWNKSMSFMFTHNWFHVALMFIERGSYVSALAIVDTCLWKFEMTEEIRGAVKIIDVKKCSRGSNGNQKRNNNDCYQQNKKNSNDENDSSNNKTSEQRRFSDSVETFQPGSQSNNNLNTIITLSSHYNHNHLCDNDPSFIDLSHNKDVVTSFDRFTQDQERGQNGVDVMITLPPPSFNTIDKINQSNAIESQWVFVGNGQIDVNCERILLPVGDDDNLNKNGLGNENDNNGPNSPSNNTPGFYFLLTPNRHNKADLNRPLPLLPDSTQIFSQHDGDEGILQQNHKSQQQHGDFGTKNGQISQKSAEVLTSQKIIEQDPKHLNLSLMMDELGFYGYTSLLTPNYQMYQYYYYLPWWNVYDLLRLLGYQHDDVVRNPTLLNNNTSITQPAQQQQQQMDTSSLSSQSSQSSLSSCPETDKTSIFLYYGPNLDSVLHNSQQYLTRQQQQQQQGTSAPKLTQSVHIVPPLEHQHYIQSVIPSLWKQFDVNYPLTLHQEHITMLYEHATGNNNISQTNHTPDLYSSLQQYSTTLQRQHADRTLHYDKTHYNTLAGVMPLVNKSNTQDQSGAIGLLWKLELHSLCNTGLICHKIDHLNQHNNNNMFVRADDDVGVGMGYNGLESGINGDNTSENSSKNITPSSCPKSSRCYHCLQVSPSLVTLEIETNTVTPIPSPYHGYQSIKANIANSNNSSSLSPYPTPQSTNSLSLCRDQTMTFPIIPQLTPRFESILSYVNLTNPHQDPFFDVLVCGALARSRKLVDLEFYIEQAIQTTQSAPQPRRGQLEAVFVPMVKSLLCFARGDYDLAAQLLVPVFIKNTSNSLIHSGLALNQHENGTHNGALKRSGGSVRRNSAKVRKNATKSTKPTSLYTPQSPRDIVKRRNIGNSVSRDGGDQGNKKIVGQKNTNIKKSSTSPSPAVTNPPISSLQSNSVDIVRLLSVFQQKISQNVSVGLFGRFSVFITLFLVYIEQTNNAERYNKEQRQLKAQNQQQDGKKGSSSQKDRSSQKTEPQQAPSQHKTQLTSLHPQLKLRQLSPFTELLKIQRYLQSGGGVSNGTSSHSSMSSSNNNDNNQNTIGNTTPFPTSPSSLFPSTASSVSLNLESHACLGGSNEQRDVLADYFCIILALAHEYHLLLLVINARLAERESLWLRKLRAQVCTAIVLTEKEYISNRISDAKL